MDGYPTSLGQEQQDAQYFVDQTLPGIVLALSADLLADCPADPLMWLSERLRQASEAAAAKAAVAAALPASDVLTILHFNDVYQIEARSREPCGGASRFVTKVKDRKSVV